jgi:formate hydrogenlyase subunit 6/NADH:ubiquinone oxidoreductase subunit I
MGAWIIGLWKQIGREMKSVSAVQAFLEAVKHMFKKTFTLKHPYQKHEFADGYRGRHLLYMDLCTGCGICAWICPEKCITIIPITDEKTYLQNPQKRFPQYWYARCCFCHFCTDYCPAGALDYTNDFDLAEYEKELIIWSPERLSRVPEAYVGYHTRFHGSAGVDHVLSTKEA